MAKIGNPKPLTRSAWFPNGRSPGSRGAGHSCRTYRLPKSEDPVAFGTTQRLPLRGQHRDSICMRHRFPVSPRGSFTAARHRSDVCIDLMIMPLKLKNSNATASSNRRQRSLSTMPNLAVFITVLSPRRASKPRKTTKCTRRVIPKSLPVTGIHIHFSASKRTAATGTDTRL